MTDELTRKRFLELAAGGLVVTVTIGCSSDDTSDEGADGADASGDGGGCSSGAVATVGAPVHGHSLTISNADIMAGTGRDYEIQGSSPHSHTITLTDADMATLMSGGTVSKSSTTVMAHDHTVDLTC